MELTPEAKERVAIAKSVMLTAQGFLGRGNEEWHVYTLKSDKKNPDPRMFSVYTTIRKGVIPFKEKIIPKQFLMSIVIRGNVIDEKKSLSIIVWPECNELVTREKEFQKIFSKIKKFKGWKIIIIKS